MLIRSPYVNPKVWYYGIIGAAQERPDMTGFKLVHPIDAMPDLFIPGPVLFEVMEKYRNAIGRSNVERNVTQITSVYREKRSSPSPSSTHWRLQKRKIRKNQELNETIADSFEKINIGLFEHEVRKNRTRLIKFSSNIKDRNKSKQKQLNIRKNFDSNADDHKSRNLLVSKMGGKSNRNRNKHKMSRSNVEKTAAIERFPRNSSKVCQFIEIYLCKVV